MLARQVKMQMLQVDDMECDKLRNSLIRVGAISRPAPYLGHKITLLTCEATIKVFCCTVSAPCSSSIHILHADSDASLVLVSWTCLYSRKMQLVKSEHSRQISTCSVERPHDALLQLCHMVHIIQGIVFGACNSVCHVLLSACNDIIDWTSIPGAARRLHKPPCYANPSGLENATGPCAVEARVAAVLVWLPR
jgi:hypothetical protein